MLDWQQRAGSLQMPGMHGFSSGLVQSDIVDVGEIRGRVLGLIWKV